MNRLCILIFFSVLLFGVGQGQSSLYQTKVLEYAPSPGQFINYKKYLNEGQDTLTLTNEQVLEKLNKSMSGNLNTLISLGSYGGSIVFGFDQSISNISDAYDFKIYGNAMYRAGYTAEDDSTGGSAEPGIVMVSRDVNKNGLADDIWYELAGSEYKSDKTIKNYRITYYKPELYSPIMWVDSEKDTGYVDRTAIHRHSTYYPIWLGDSLIFKGTKLASNSLNLAGGTGHDYLLLAYDYGYADNHLNTSEHTQFKIEWAVDSLGNTVDLPSIDFVKIYTGINKFHTNIGEVSTEVAGIEYLGLCLQNTDLEYINNTVKKIEVYPNPFINKIRVDLRIEPKFGSTNYGVSPKLILYTMDGRKIMYWDMKNKDEISLDLGNLKVGIYILKFGSAFTKIIKK